MAGIEKICEFSGEYPGWEMYGMKRNHIQIDKKFRELFKGADAELVVTKIEILFGKRSSSGGYSYTMVNEWEILDYFDNDPYYWMDYHAYHEKRKPMFQYTYELRVKNPELQGRVKGVYLNWCFDFHTTKRKLKRMIGPGLKIRSEVRSRTRVMKDWAKDVVTQNTARNDIRGKGKSTSCVV